MSRLRSIGGQVSNAPADPWHARLGKLEEILRLDFLTSGLLNFRPSGGVSRLRLETLGACGSGQSMGNVYFSIGDAIAGLGIFLLIPQYLKPIYVFRLRVIGIGLRWLYAFPGLGFLCVVMASIVPHFPSQVPLFIRLPLAWELVGAALYAVSYVALAWVYIFPARSAPRSISNYVRAGTNLLASGSEEDRVELGADILANIRKLIRIADTQQGADAQSVSAAGYSESFLLILSDPEFCRTLVARVPWDAARILVAFSEERPSKPVGRSFVHQIVRNTVICGEISGVKEVDRLALSDAPPLAKVAFGDAFLNSHYEPWESFEPTDFDDVDLDRMERVCTAARLTIDEEVKGDLSEPSANLVRLQEVFEVLSRRLYVLKKGAADIAPLANVFGQAVKHIVGTVRARCAALPPEARDALYADTDAIRDFTALDTVAELVISVLENTSPEFSGFDDKLWNMTREIWDSVMPRFGTQEAGMDPLQQRFALKLLENIRESMEGYYSALSRQALAVIGPYNAKAESKERTAFKICRDAFYHELLAFPAFEASDPARAASFLPNNVRYEAETTALVHRYSFGGEDKTVLRDLVIANPSLALECVVDAGAVKEATPAA